MTDWPFTGLERGKYGAILADPPWHFKAWAVYKPLASGGHTRAVERYYQTLDWSEIAKLPVKELAADDSVLFLWICWPMLTDAAAVMDAWGFDYKTCAFAWVKGNSLPLFPDDFKDKMGLGYWTRANSEVCLLGTRGKPKRLNADVRQVIQEPLREHSRKPDCVHERIERLVAGPYCELFARARRPGWDVWGNQTDKFTVAA